MSQETFSIITPSFQQLDWLRLALASVADQEGVEVEHIIQDAGSEGVEEMFQKIAEVSVHSRGRNAKLFVEEDAGMYDAINRGLRRASGQICGYLNCDEQYLLGALSRVASTFESNPEIDVFLAGSLVVDAEGQYICSRPALKPMLRHLKAGLMYNFSCSMFFRAKLFREENFFFDPHLRVIGDLDWLRRVMEAGARVETLDFFTSAFSDLGTNLALSATASTEAEAANLSGNVFRRLSYAAIVMSHRLRRLLAGHYSLRPFDYSIYTLQQDKKRRTFHVARPTGVWRNRL